MKFSRGFRCAISLCQVKGSVSSNFCPSQSRQGSKVSIAANFHQSAEYETVNVHLVVCIGAGIFVVVVFVLNLTDFSATQNSKGPLGAKQWQW